MKKTLIYALLCAMVSLIGCEKLKDITSRDFTVNNIAFDFTATAQDNVTTQSGDPAVTARAGETTSFTVTRTVDISEMGNNDIIEYANKINKIAVNSSVITVTSSPAGAYTVTNLKVTTAGVTGELLIPSYTMGNAFVAPANMNAYTTAFIMRLLSAKTVQVTVAGQSDAPAGTTINIKYESDIVCTASLL